jgi:hypothetical protein
MRNEKGIWFHRKQEYQFFNRTEKLGYQPSENIRYAFVQLRFFRLPGGKLKLDEAHMVEKKGISDIETFMRGYKPLPETQKNKLKSCFDKKQKFKILSKTGYRAFLLEHLDMNHIERLLKEEEL